MAFVTGLMLIDAPASALNNSNERMTSSSADNSSATKYIRSRNGENFPYVSAQAFRYWLRTTLEDNSDSGWVKALIFRDDKNNVAHTDANPIKYWDDDLFGYMRANKKSQDFGTYTPGTVTRIAPLRVSTLVSIAPVTITDDFGVMARHEGNPVTFEHQFYRTTLKGLFSLDLWACGTFSYRNRTGFRNLDETRLALAQEQALQHLESHQCYRLSIEERIRRVRALFEGMARLEGGAKQTIHYTAVAPALVILAVTKGGNNIFNYAIGEGRSEKRGLPVVNIEAVQETLEVFGDELLSPVYVGWAKGFHDDERTRLMNWLNPPVPPEGDDAARQEYKRIVAQRSKIIVAHPRRAFEALIKDLGEHPEWME